MDVDRHYIGIVTATTHKEKGIITLVSNPSWGTVLPAPHGKGKSPKLSVHFSKLSVHFHFRLLTVDKSNLLVPEDRL